MVGLASCGPISEWPCPWVDLFGFEVCEDFMDRFFLGNDGEDLHFGVAVWASECDVEDALE